jgi:hypothetical protein
VSDSSVLLVYTSSSLLVFPVDALSVEVFMLLVDALSVESSVLLVDTFSFLRMLAVLRVSGLLPKLSRALSRGLLLGRKSASMMREFLRSDIGLVVSSLLRLESLERMMVVGVVNVLRSFVQSVFLGLDLQCLLVLRTLLVEEGLLERSLLYSLTVQRVLLILQRGFESNTVLLLLQSMSVVGVIDILQCLAVLSVLDSDRMERILLVSEGGAKGFTFAVLGNCFLVVGIILVTESLKISAVPCDLLRSPGSRRGLQPSRLGGSGRVGCGRSGAGRLGCSGRMGCAGGRRGGGNIALVQIILSAEEASGVKGELGEGTGSDGNFEILNITSIYLSLEITGSIGVSVYGESENTGGEGRSENNKFGGELHV